MTTARSTHSQARVAVHRLRGILSVGIAALALSLAACGLESDGSHSNRKNASAASVEGSVEAQIGRYQTEVVRLGVPRPFFLLIDTATGGVERRMILGSQKFRPLVEEPPPGAEIEPKIAGRYEVKVTPGRRGSGLMRLDTVTGRSWFYQLGADQASWYEIGRLADEGKGRAAPSAAAPGGESANKGDESAAADGGKPRNENELRGLKEVLGDSSYDMQLRIWTAKHMAELYPVEAAEMASTKLAEEDPRILVAIANTAELDADGRVRAAFKQLAGHNDEKVAAAIAERIGSSAQ